jgi:hypothetical protein
LSLIFWALAVKAVEIARTVIIFFMAFCFR